MELGRCLTYFFLVACIFIWSSGHACTVSPLVRESALEALQRASAIGIVRVDEIHHNENGIYIKNVIVESLFGDDETLQSVSFKCPQCDDDSLPSRTAKHKSVSFYDGLYTNIGFLPDCSHLPSAVSGGEYIYLRSDPVSRFVFEPIEEGSPWLSSVRNFLDGKSFEPISVDDYIESATDIQIIKCTPDIRHYTCIEGANFVIFLWEDTGSRISFPSEDGSCFPVQEWFRKNRGFELRGIEVGEAYCLDNSRGTSE